MLLLIGGTGLWLTLRLGFLPIRRLGFGFRQLFGRSQGDGTIAGYAALATAMAATVGTGNIAGVATAIALGGPGALVWMWLIALVGIATKYSEAVLAVHFRQQDSHGQYIGGPMYYIRNGLGPKFGWLAFLFALFGMFAGFGIGNGVQAHSVADGLHSTFGFDTTYTGLVMAVLVAMVILGGIKRIAHVATALVPLMALAYLLCGMAVLIDHAEQLPAALARCLSDAFTGSAAGGGFAGATVWAAIRFGIARGIFSNEAGLGSTPIAHASATTDHPARQGSIAMLGSFIDTIIICSITGLAIVVTGAFESGQSGAPLSALAFSATFGPMGETIVVIGLAVFAFTTLLGWSLYGERCAQYLFGERAVLPFRLFWIAMVPVGAASSLTLIWDVADVLNALMALPNLIALLLLSPLVVKLTKEFFNREKA
ncbi:sodium:alanine symporter family protein [Alcanivorax sp. 1008]|uniref:alanine/glycine:cation symporter family protein n=1 Tax=Alcanivorax sp. 1008 TaxID=2816853 RepID=UPI001E4A475D|nr:sodium:alanine symporter family protein [Alcanivorax sp. 1008]